MRLLLRLLPLFSASALSAQQTSTAGAPDTSVFRRLELPAPNSIRTGSGTPGPDYWQQRADYVIRATLDTSARSLRGEARITYTNNSPDTLRYIWLQLDQNVFHSQSRGTKIFDPRARFGTGGAEGGVRILKIAQPAVAAARGRAASPASQLSHVVNGTVMKVDLAAPLAPRAKQEIDVSWSFPFGPNRNRMGIEEIDGGVTYEVAQWYPRLAVYDDIRGWNTEQYLGQGEFYLEYGSFDVSITVPADMIVAATGVLRNPADVLTATQRSRLAQAGTSSSTVVIRGRDEVGDPASRPAAEYGNLTWRFTADSVRDFAWAASKTFIWDAVGVNGGKTLAMSFYPPSTAALWKEATQYGKFAIENYSAQWAPYPYPTASNVRGSEGGMEYPMIVFCNRPTPETLYSVTDHEFGHTWFPMVVGSNERRYPWMDEGFNEFINYYNWVKRFGLPPAHRGSIRDYLAMATSGEERPVMTFADQLPPMFVSPAAYDKPALALRLLREVVVGPERFDPAFKEYFRRWAYKHPTPADFFRTIEDGVGEDLSWFWRSWLYTTAQLDQAVDSIALADSVGVESRIFLRNAGGIPMPVDLGLLMDDGSTQRLTLPVEIWYGGDRYTAIVPGPKKVNAVTLDPESRYPDVRRENNRWPAALQSESPATPPRSATGR
ncbi:MAG: M1 family metallopeptidase [Gemmatimonadales bacterium]|nr:M1 family metallopeptidase [Gemmatimonadales bacterium]